MFYLTKSIVQYALKFWKQELIINSMYLLDISCIVFSSIRVFYLKNRISMLKSLIFFFLFGNLQHFSLLLNTYRIMCRVCVCYFYIVKGILFLGVLCFAVYCDCLWNTLVHMYVINNMLFYTNMCFLFCFFFA